MHIQDPYVDTMLCMQMPRLFHTLLGYSVVLTFKWRRKRKNVTKIWHQTWNSLNLFGLFVAFFLLYIIFVCFVSFPLVFCLFFFFNYISISANSAAVLAVDLYCESIYNWYFLSLLKCIGDKVVCRSADAIIIDYWNHRNLRLFLAHPFQQIRPALYSCRRVYFR